MVHGKSPLMLGAFRKAWSVHLLEGPWPSCSGTEYRDAYNTESMKEREKQHSAGSYTTNDRKYIYISLIK